MIPFRGHIAPLIRRQAGVFLPKQPGAEQAGAYHNSQQEQQHWPHGKHWRYRVTPGHGYLLLV